MHGDEMTAHLLAVGRLRVDAEDGLVYAPRSNTPDKPVGALTRKGYLRLCVNVGGKQHYFMVHRIVWVSAHGPLPPGFQIDHGKGGKTDNRLSNLEGVTGAENMQRGVRDGKFTNVGRRDGIRDSKGRFGFKARAGHLLDGREHHEFPGESNA